MEIINGNIKDTKTLYRMAHINSMKPSEHVGEVLTINGWAIMTSVNRKTGQAQEVLYLDTDSGIFGTISPTFKESFQDIVDCFGDDFSRIEIIGGVSRAGRNYISCALVD